MKVVLEKFKGKVEDVHFIDDDNGEHFLVSTTNGITGYGGTEKYMKNKEAWVEIAEKILKIENIEEIK